MFRSKLLCRMFIGGGLKELEEGGEKHGRTKTAPGRAEGDRIRDTFCSSQCNPHAGRLGSRSS